MVPPWLVTSTSKHRATYHPSPRVSAAVRRVVKPCAVSLTTILLGRYYTRRELLADQCPLARPSWKASDPAVAQRQMGRMGRKTARPASAANLCLVRVS